MGLRIGIGRDFHRLTAGSGFWLGGVHIPATHAVVAHSDGDCLIHALVDALLGAMARPDIGVHFPANETNRGRSSCEMLKEVWDLFREAGFRLENFDATISLERPRLVGFIDPIRRRLASLLSIDVGRIGLKATTGEGCGPIGRSEGIEVMCVCLISEESKRSDGRSV